MLEFRSLQLARPAGEEQVGGLRDSVPFKNKGVLFLLPGVSYDAQHVRGHDRPESQVVWVMQTLRLGSLVGRGKRYRYTGTVACPNF